MLYTYFSLLYLCIRGIAPGWLDSDFLGQTTLRHVMRMTRTWDSTMSMIPRGGDTIWGALDWSPEEGSVCPPDKEDSNRSIGMNYGRMISFGKDVADAPASDIDQIDFRVSYVTYIGILCSSLHMKTAIPVSGNRSGSIAWHGGALPPS